MKLVRSSNGIKPFFIYQFSWGSSVSVYSTETEASKPLRDTLYGRISPVGDPNVSIAPVLDKWIEEGRTVNPNALRSMIRQLRFYRRFKHALEISRWMSDRRFMFLSPSDIAVRLDLISRVHGLEQAENYFNSIPKQSRVLQVYGAFINCYAREKSVEKAEALMQQMKDLGFSITSIAYNSLLHLYSQVGQHEKLEALMEEMNEKGIPVDRFTYSIWLSSYAATPNVDGMEKVLKRMEADSQLILDRSCYTVAADGYIKAGLIDKALEMLKKSEEIVTPKNRKVAYNVLLTLYARTGRKDELYRIWNKYKSSKKVYNSAYMCMIISLLKLGDIEGAEKIFEDWESRCTGYDFRVPNFLIAAYCDNGLVEKAELVINNAIENGKKPITSTWDRLATAYIKNNQIDKAIKSLKKAILASEPGWKPGHDLLSACVEYLKGIGDVEEAEEFARLLGVLDSPSSTDVFERLLNYVDGAKPESRSAHEFCEEHDMVDNEEHDILETSR